MRRYEQRAPTVSSSRRSSLSVMVRVSGIEWTQEDRWLKMDKRGWGSVESWAERSRLLIEQGGISAIAPLASVQSVDERIEGGDGLCRGEGAVARAIHENLAQQVSVTSRIDDTLVRLLVLVDYQTVASGVHGENREMQVSIEGDELTQVVHSAGISRDTRRAIERVEVLVQT